MSRIQKVRCKDVIRGMKVGDSTIVSESRGESLRWAARELGCTIATRRLTVGAGGSVRVSLTWRRGERRAA